MKQKEYLGIVWSSIMKVKITNQSLKIEDFKAMEALEYTYYDKAFITPAEEAYLWYLHEPTSIVVAKVNHQIVGFMNLLLIEEETYESIWRGVFNDALLRVDHLFPYRDYCVTPSSNKLAINPDEQSKTFSAYVFLSCIIVDKSYHKTNVAPLLLDYYVKWLKSLQKTGLAIGPVITDNVTEAGEGFSKKIGLSFIRRSNHDSVIYSAPLDQFMLKAENYIKTRRKASQEAE